MAIETGKTFTFGNAITTGLLIEAILVFTQFIYLNIYAGTHSGIELAFSTEYMTSGGFYIFQIGGFFLYVVAVYYIISRYSIPNFASILVLVLTGGIAEVLFYILTMSQYGFASFFSVLDKFIAAFFGVIIYFCSHRN